ncbi:MAG: hypothetical protein WCJ30_21515 [Deltaproteobacteria bacterium]
MRSSSLFLALFLPLLAGCPQAITPADAADDVQRADTTATDTTADSTLPQDVTVPPDASDAPPVRDVVPDSSRTDTGPVDASVTDCVFGGVYVTSLGYFRFSADGLWSGGATATGFDVPGAPGGTWSVAGTRFTIRDNGTTAGCPATQAGVYDMAFAPGCGTVTLTLVSDDCAQRSSALSGMVFTVVP